MTRLGVCLSAVLACALIGCGDDEGTSTGSLSSGSGGGGGTGGGDGGAGGVHLVHGCDPLSTQKLPNNAIIDTMVLAYTPRCVRMSAGFTVTFHSDFATHPLVGGRADGGEEVPDPASPILPTSDGDTVTFTLPAAGEFGFYCDNHGLAGMNGAIFVE